MSSSSNRQHKAAIDAFKKLLLYDKTNLLSLLYQLNIKTECNDHNSVSSVSRTNYNNSSVPIETDNLSALYAHYQIDPPPDLQFDRITQPSFYLSHSYLQPSKLQNNSSRRRKQKRFKSNRNRKRNNRVETDNFHYRNMITVRRISCHDILDPQMMRKRSEYRSNKFENEPRKNERNRRTRSVNLMENKSQKYQTFSIGFQPSSILSTSNKSIVSPSTPNSHTRILTRPISNALFSQRDIEKKMSNSVDITGSKVISSHDLSVSSLASTQLRTTGYDQIKPNVTIATSVTPGSQNDFRSLTDHSPHLSPTTSIVPHFSSTIAPHVPHHISSSTILISNAPKNESISTSPNENIQDLVDQLKTCIDMLSLLLQNKTEHEKLRIPNIKSYSDQEKINKKNKQSQSSTSDHSKLTETSIPNKNNLIFEDITVRQCHSPIDQVRKKISGYPNKYNDRPNELKRCLLVYCRNRDRNINSNDLSTSRSTVILAEEDDEYV